MIDIAVSRISDLVDMGGPVVAALMVLSVVALTCIIWKATVFAIEGIGARNLRGQAGNTLADMRRAQTQEHAVSDLRERVIARLEAGFERAGSGLRVLDVIAQIAPLLGLFGTVLGMIDAFRTLQEAGGTADPAVLAGGIWVALVTTAAGLIVAMPTSVALNWFDARLERHRCHILDHVEGILTPDVFDTGISTRG